MTAEEALEQADRFEKLMRNYRRVRIHDSAIPHIATLREYARLLDQSNMHNLHNTPGPEEKREAVKELVKETFKAGRLGPGPVNIPQQLENITDRIIAAVRGKAKKLEWKDTAPLEREAVAAGLRYRVLSATGRVDGPFVAQVFEAAAPYTHRYIGKPGSLHDMLAACEQDWQAAYAEAGE
jgi:hypothetical protein